MPESRSRKPKKGAGSAAELPATQAAAKKKGPSPAWLLPISLGLMCLGLAWLVATYLTSAAWPIASLGQWNLAVGFGLIMVGFFMLMGWR